MSIIAVGLALIFLSYIYRNYWWLLLKAKQVGVETDAVVSRIEKDKRSADGADYPRTFYYVAFPRQDGLPTEARLLNPKGPLEVGSRLRIKYLEEKNDCAVLIRIEQA